MSRSPIDPSEGGIRYVECGEPGYPPQLTDLHDPPAGLFLRGAEIPPADRIVAMVGARACSAAGGDIARAIARGLASAGITVVSGAARGIDAAAHEGSLAAGGTTIAVLGSGIDVAYPRSSARLLARIVSQGTVVSEYPPGVPAMAFRFPARNRIVVALARALIVVEGEEGSGSLISAEYALDLGRDVFAVPGSVMSPLAATPNALIRDGATLVRGFEDVLADLGVEAPSTAAMSGQLAFDLAADDRRILDAVVDRVLPESVADAVGLPVGDVIPILFRLELAGILRNVGGRYERRLQGKVSEGAS